MNYQEFQTSIVGEALYEFAKKLIEEQAEDTPSVYMSTAQTNLEVSTLWDELCRGAFEQKVPDWIELGNMTAERVDKYIVEEEQR